MRAWRRADGHTDSKIFPENDSKVLPLLGWLAGLSYLVMMNLVFNLSTSHMLQGAFPSSSRTWTIPQTRRRRSRRRVRRLRLFRCFSCSERTPVCLVTSTMNCMIHTGTFIISCCLTSALHGQPSRLLACSHLVVPSDASSVVPRHRPRRPGIVRRHRPQAQVVA